MSARITPEDRRLAEALADGPPASASAFVASLARALAETREEAREAGVRPFRDLFGGGPDTVCRTTWRTEPGILQGEQQLRTECVEVPLDDLRAAFVEAGDEAPESEPDRVVHLLTGGDGVGTEERARALVGHLAFYGYRITRREGS